MAQDLFAQFDKQYDVAGLQADIKDVADNNASYKEVPDGDYEVAITKMELKATKEGKPMVSVWFKIVNGDYKGQLIFANFVLTSGFGIHKCNEFLRSLGSNLDVDFTTFSAYGKLVAELFEYAKDYEFALEYIHNSRNYPEYTINDIFELQ